MDHHSDFCSGAQAASNQRDAMAVLFLCAVIGRSHSLFIQLYVRSFRFLDHKSDCHVWHVRSVVSLFIGPHCTDVAAAAVYKNDQLVFAVSIYGWVSDRNIERGRPRAGYRVRIWMGCCLEPVFYARGHVALEGRAKEKPSGGGIMCEDIGACFANFFELV